jgi:flagellar basal-body rod protein FlgB
MFLERMLNQGGTPMLEKLLDFTSARARLIDENSANIGTPGYITKDLDEKKFFGMLQQRVEQSQGGEANFDDMPMDLTNPTAGVLFHDGNNRSVEQIASDMAKNTMTHNLVVELLRKQFQQLNMALAEKVS